MTAAARRPTRLAPGDTVAVLSPSWGGPHAFPHVFEHGLEVLRGWGLLVREYPTTRADPAALAADPAARARDLNAAFADPEVRGIFASIGGDDSVRLLPLLDRVGIAADPKVVLGYSDTTVLLAAVRACGIVALHGPAVMAGISQLGAMEPPAADHVRAMLFDARAPLQLPAFGRVSWGYPDWRDPTLVGQVHQAREAGDWHILQAGAPVEGELWGGCIEVLDWLRGSWAWPGAADWSGRLLFLEASEEQPSPLAVTRMLRAMGAQGAFDGIAGVLVGRARDRDESETAAFEHAIVAAVRDEFGRTDIPIVANLPFGHTDPQWVLPIGARARLDAAARSLTLTEAWLA